MNDWADIPERPTLCIDFPWQEKPVGYCLNCGTVVPTLWGKRHAVDSFRQPACGIEFQFVTTRAADEEWQQKVAEMRPDLLYTYEGNHLD